MHRYDPEIMAFVTNLVKDLTTDPIQIKKVYDDMANLIKNEIDHNKMMPIPEHLRDDD